jgi:hypothetical protein
MDDKSYFESRTGKLACSDKEVFAFVTDIRNFERFIPEGTISNWQSEREWCSFNVSMLGTVSFRLSGKEMYNRVAFTGDALKKNDFSLVLNISGDAKDATEVKVLLNAYLNPVMKMIADKPIRQFLEMVVNEMERFNGWKGTTV